MLCTIIIRVQVNLKELLFVSWMYWDEATAGRHSYRVYWSMLADPICLSRITRYGPSLRRQIPYSPFLTDEGVLILHVKTRWLKVTLTWTMYIVIMPLLLIIINRKRGKEVRAGTEKYVLSEWAHSKWVNMTCAEAKQTAVSESAIRGKDPINHIPWYDM